jgi:hypothetical protein
MKNDKNTNEGKFQNKQIYEHLLIKRVAKHLT